MLSENLLYTIEKENHTPEKLRSILASHPEVAFVSMAGVDFGGQETDEKIPLSVFLSDMEGFLKNGVQTDGSAVLLPGIAVINNGRVDLIPDLNVNWYVDYNLSTSIGTLRIPAFLYHNGLSPVGPRHILKKAVMSFEFDVFAALQKHPYGLLSLGIQSAEELAGMELTGATELEFWVKTPDDSANQEQLFTSQSLKEQYWQRTSGPVRTALEETILLLNRYGFSVEMGHKEVGGVAARLSHNGQYDHIMEQLELDWKYASPVQAADNELFARNIITDVFRSYGLDVTFQAKPVPGVAGNGEHTHLGAKLVLRNGRKVNLFAARDPMNYLSVCGFGALMGLLRNYEAIEGFVANTNDALLRLKPGFEAPICVVTALGISPREPSRNRTVLIGLIRNLEHPEATRFELRSPNPKSNTYLVFASCLMAMLDGILACLSAEKNEKELLRSVSKPYGEPDFYLEENRAYRSEKDLYEAYSEADRRLLFGNPPATVWEALSVFDAPTASEIRGIEALGRNGVFTKATLSSYRQLLISQWIMEIHNRMIPSIRKQLRDYKRLDGPHTDYDEHLWQEVDSLRKSLGQTTTIRKSLLHRLSDALESKDGQAVSDLLVLTQRYADQLETAYHTYERNVL